MARPDPIQYAERLYGAIRAANFSPISFLAFGNAIKDGVSMRHMPRIAAEPFMRVVGEMLDLEEETDVSDAEIITGRSAPTTNPSLEEAGEAPRPHTEATPRIEIESQDNPAEMAGTAASPRRANPERKGGAH